MKAATLVRARDAGVNAISIHAAREGGDGGEEISARNLYISIHAAREGGDMTKAKFDAKRVIFQSTPPVKAATEVISDKIAEANISIHAAREGGDHIPHFSA